MKKHIPRGTIKSVATLVYPSGLSISLPDEFPSSRYLINRHNININVSTNEEKTKMKSSTTQLLNCLNASDPEVYNDWS